MLARTGRSGKKGNTTVAALLLAESASASGSVRHRHQGKGSLAGVARALIGKLIGATQGAVIFYPTTLLPHMAAGEGVRVGHKANGLLQPEKEQHCESSVT